MACCVSVMDCRRSVALAAEESESLLALVVLFERHHVDRAHGFDSRLHFVVLRVCRAQFLARK